MRTYLWTAYEIGTDLQLIPVKSGIRLSDNSEQVRRAVSRAAHEQWPGQDHTLVPCPELPGVYAVRADNAACLILK